MKFILCIVAFGLLMPSAHAKTLRLVTLESPPAEFSENRESSGRNVEIAVECLRRMGACSTVKILPWKRALMLVEKGLADAIIDAAYNSQRADFLYFPDEEIYVEEWYAFKRKGEVLTFDRDLGNVGQYTVGICRGFEYGGLVQKSIRNRWFKDIQEVVNNEMNIKKLIAGRFDVFVGVKLTIFNLARKMGYGDQIELVTMTETNQPYLLSSSKTYVAFSKKNIKLEMVEIFSNTLKKMKMDGTVSAIEKKYW